MEKSDLLILGDFIQKELAKASGEREFLKMVLAHLFASDARKYPVQLREQFTKEFLAEIVSVFDEAQPNPEGQRFASDAVTEYALSFEKEVLERLSELDDDRS